MNKRIYVSLLALPIYFYHVEVTLVKSSEALSLINQHLSTTTVTQISARDEQTGDCLRRRDCKD
jgi:hypothetical protein